MDHGPITRIVEMMVSTLMMEILKYQQKKKKMMEILKLYRVNSLGLNNDTKCQ